MSPSRTMIHRSNDTDGVEDQRKHGEPKGDSGHDCVSKSTMMNGTFAISSEHAFDPGRSDGSPLINYGAQVMDEMIVRGKGLYIYTNKGHRILDFTSGQLSCSLGHCNDEVVHTLRSTALEMDHISSCMLAPSILGLARQLTSLLPEGLDKAVFFSTGSESNEAAIRMAKHYTGKFEIVALGESWHGMTSGAQGAQYHAGRKGHGPGVPGQLMLPQPNAYRSIFRHEDGSYDWRAEMEYGWSLVDQQSCGSLAACIVEYIQGDGGIHVLPAGYLAALKDHCEARGMLLIVDEAQTGLGRTGKLFGFEHDGVVPDILTLSKALANGLPLSAVITSEEIDARCRERGFMFFTTHTNEPLLASVAGKVCEIILRDDLARNAKEKGQELLAGLHRLEKRTACIGDVRGRGLMVGIEIVDSKATKSCNPKLAKAISDAMWEKGLWCQLQAGKVLRIGPPINITSAQIAEGLVIIESAFDSIDPSLYQNY